MEEDRVADRLDEAFNIQSQERADLLSELRDAVGQDAVKAAMWACLQVCDISKLRELVGYARGCPSTFALLEYPSLSIPLHWMQRPLRDRATSLTTSNSPATPSDGTLRRSNRLKKPVKLAKERDGYKCVLTNITLCEAAHIFPHCMINETPPQTSLAAAVPPFWKLLHFFFEPDRLNRWRAEIFKDPSNPTQTADGCHNMICLSPIAHEMWSRGQFALRPVSMSDDCKELTVKFYWQPKPPHDRFASVNIQMAPNSSRDLVQVNGSQLAIFNNTDSQPAIKSGDTFIFRTTNPDTHPLPSFELLDMQWCLQRIVSMSGAAGVYDEEDDDDDNDDDSKWHKGVVHKSISEWDIYSWVPPPPSDSASSEGDELDSSTTSSISPTSSPLKPLAPQGKNLSVETRGAEPTVSCDALHELATV
ncbi:conserved hypothetical protein [Histoplasma capsulatum G186AR]|uniref:HNH nuclease domain-containing protein n=2 Tax=Ajellomyces capsulatus TaxID=5037 RepID=C0NVL4_AJECG|nr:uncharacterized protein HCBG_07194 [Histoplasma capsulatum G186AR]EEH04553.1 conserved hypothetical protein [Histoplasma capsulatum G186AR]